MHIIDLRSDTITKPTPAMRQAMAEAEVGDDVLGDDPTVSRLEEMAAARLGKEAGLFVASGTQGNLVSLLTQCGRGDEVIIGDQAHTFRYEQGGCAALGGIMPHLVRNQPDGTMDLDELEAAIRPDDIHLPRTRLICLENTHNRCGGVPLTVEYMQPGRGARAQPRPAPAHRRRAPLQCGGRARRRREGTGRGRGLGHVLPQQGAGRAGRLGGLRQHASSSPQAHRNRKVVGGGHAPGGRARGSGHRGAGRDGRPPGRRPRERRGAGRGPGGPARHRGRAGVRAHRHRLLQDPAPRHGRRHASASG